MKSFDATLPVPPSFRLSDETSLHSFLAKGLSQLCLEETGRRTEAPASVLALPWNLWDFTQQIPFEADKEPLEFDQHSYLVPIYQAIDYGPKVHPDGFKFVTMKGAQVCLTVTAFAAIVLAMLKFWGRKFGYFLPTERMANDFSSDRFAPLIRSNGFLASLYDETEDTGEKKENRKGLRHIGESSLYFRYMHGVDSTESIPMTGIFFDEVRRMFDSDIERAEERISHAAYPINVKLSTAGYPDCNIHKSFKQSTQNIWFSRCRCKEGIDLAWHWPECIGEGKDELFYRCPRCDKRIDNPRDGRFVARMPENLKKEGVIGFHVPQILSPRKTAADMWRKWMNASDRQEFMNSTLGMPWLDPDSILVPESVARTCVTPDLKWVRKSENCFMGVDQRPNEIHAVIGDKPESKVRIRHLEIIQGDDPFARLYHLMHQFDVDCCVVDALPEYNEAMRFAKHFPRRVFLAYYADHVHMIRWSDRDEQLKTIQRTEKDAKFEFHVMIDRYKAIEYALMQWVLRQIACPTPEALTQEVLVKGLKRQSCICLGNSETGEQGLFYHLRSVARRRVEKQRRDAKERETFETGEFTMVWENIGVDPHFLHAFLYMLVSSLRRQSTAHIYLPGTSGGPKSAEEIGQEQPNLSATQAGDAAQIQRKVLPMIQLASRLTIPGTCSACEHFDETKAFCRERRFGTRPEMPACEVFLKRTEP